MKQPATTATLVAAMTFFVLGSVLGVMLALVLTQS